MPVFCAPTDCPPSGTVALCFAKNKWKLSAIFGKCDGLAADSLARGRLVSPPFFVEPAFDWLKEPRLRPCRLGRAQFAIPAVGKWRSPLLHLCTSPAFVRNLRTVGWSDKERAETDGEGIKKEIQNLWSGIG